MIYEYEKDGASVGNKSGTYGKTTHTFINCLGTNTCDETYFIQIEVYVLHTLKGLPQTRQSRYCSAIEAPHYTDFL